MASSPREMRLTCGLSLFSCSCVSSELHSCQAEDEDEVVQVQDDCFCLAGFQSSSFFVQSSASWLFRSSALWLSTSRMTFHGKF